MARRQAVLSISLSLECPRTSLTCRNKPTCLSWPSSCYALPQYMPDLPETLIFLTWGVGCLNGSFVWLVEPTASVEFKILSSVMSDLCPSPLLQGLLASQWCCMKIAVFSFPILAQVCIIWPYFLGFNRTGSFWLWAHHPTYRASSCCVFTNSLHWSCFRSCPCCWAHWPGKEDCSCVVAVSSWHFLCSDDVTLVIVYSAVVACLFC